MIRKAVLNRSASPTIAGDAYCNRSQHALSMEGIIQICYEFSGQIVMLDHPRMRSASTTDIQRFLLENLGGHTIYSIVSSRREYLCVYKIVLMDKWMSLV